MEGGEIGEDWELLLQSSGEEDDETTAGVETSHGSFRTMIKSDYFSLENHYAKSEAGSVESDNPSWVDPVAASAYKETAGLLSDLGSDDRKGHDFEAKSELPELGIAGNGESDELSEPVDENLGEYDVGIEAIAEVGSFDNEASDNLWSDSSGGERRCSVESVKFEEEDDSIGSNKELEEEEESTDETRSVVAVQEVKAVDKSGGENEKRMVLWWKVPMEVLKYCVFKVSPVWSVSVAAAVMGLVILGRILYRMKRKSQSLQLKLALDDKKKVSQFMSRAERLNEAFSVVRRVPILRPSLPPSGINPWPVMSLR